MGIIYLVQPAQLIGTDRYKLGCSRESGTKRVDIGYNDGTVVHIVEYVDNPFEVERTLVQRFNELFRCVGGREYFAGDIKQMLKCFKTITNALMSDDENENGNENGHGNVNGNGNGNEIGNVHGEGEGVVEANKFQCYKCKKMLSRIDHLRDHERKCTGVPSNQCPRCFKTFVNSHGKWKHVKYVKCQSFTLQK